MSASLRLLAMPFSDPTSSVISGLRFQLSPSGGSSSPGIGRLLAACGVAGWQVRNKAGSRGREQPDSSVPAPVRLTSMDSLAPKRCRQGRMYSGGELGQCTITLSLVTNREIGKHCATTRGRSISSPKRRNYGWRDVSWW
jgi:hypothetical protein